MFRKPITSKVFWCLTAFLALMPTAWAAEPNSPADMLEPPMRIKTAVAESPAKEDGAFNQILQAGCTSCGGGLLGAPGYTGASSCSGDDCEGGCFPGRKNCVACNGQNCVSRAFCAFYDCICCPDPCYEPRWIAGANAAFFVDSARPVTQMRLRWDSGHNLTQPDRAEFFWAAAGGKGPARAETSLRYNSLSMYNEAATERFSVFTEIPYLSIDPVINPGAGGFGDLKIGTKSLLLDCELMQATLQFTTSVPTGNFRKGLGTGHVSLAPALLTAIKLCTDTYLQTQLIEWIPIGGTPGVQGSVLQYGASLNHVLCRPVADTQLIGTIEGNGYSFQSGSFTDPVLGRVSGNGTTYFSVGPGLRFVICDKIDIGVGAAFSITNEHFAEQLYRTEFRWRF